MSEDYEAREEPLTEADKEYLGNMVDLNALNRSPIEIARACGLVRNDEIAMPRPRSESIKHSR